MSKDELGVDKYTVFVGSRLLELGPSEARLCA